MATSRNKHQNRYRRMRSAILTGSLLSFLPLFVLMRSAAGDTSASADLATSAQGIAVTASATQTTSSKNAGNQTAATSQSTSTQAVATPTASTASTSSSTTTSSAMTYTRTKAS